MCVNEPDGLGGEAPPNSVFAIMLLKRLPDGSKKKRRLETKKEKHFLQFSSHQIICRAPKNADLIPSHLDFKIKPLL